MQRHSFAEDPIEVFARQVWVSPYYEDDLAELKGQIGAGHIIFGSDWPHAEGLADPVAFVDDLGDFSSPEIEQIMRTNGLALTERVGQ
jgi:predicted TIM-barrel fold metal-dependent hydrolase